jgi:hypothetical protein
MVIGFNKRTFKDLDTYIYCIHGKTHKFTFPKTGVTRAFEVLGLIHSDICGPLKPSTYSSFQHFMTLIDDYSQYCTIYLLKKKLDIYTTFKQWKTYIKNQFKDKIKAIQFDNGAEYNSLDFNSFCAEHGIH